MLGHDPYYYAIFRKAVVSFAKIFIPIHLVRKNDQVLKVPITYAQKERYFYRVQQDEALDKAVKMQLPRMAFQFTSLNYDTSRKKLQKNQIQKVKDGLVHNYTFESVCYDITAELSIISRNQDDAQQILEQILPFFKPEYTLSLNIIPELDIKDDMPISLSSIDISTTFDSSWMDEERIVYTLTFNFPLNFYGPISTQKIIKKAQTDFLIPTGDITDENMSKTPRTIRETLEVVPFSAMSDEEYEILETIEYFFDNKKFNPKTLQDETI